MSKLNRSLESLSKLHPVLLSLAKFSRRSEVSRGAVTTDEALAGQHFARLRTSANQKRQVRLSVSCNDVKGVLDVIRRSGVNAG